MSMSDTTRDFLRELCEIVKSYHDGLANIGRDAHSLEMALPRAFREQYAHIIQDDAKRAEILPFVRLALTSAVFHTLVLLDEHKELGQTKVQPYLKLYRNDSEVPCPNYLHELFGDVMHDIGMDLYEWWGVK
jgi:hypothetical protein